MKSIVLISFLLSRSLVAIFLDALSLQVCTSTSMELAHVIVIGTPFAVAKRKPVITFVAIVRPVLSRCQDAAVTRDT